MPLPTISPAATDTVSVVPMVAGQSSIPGDIFAPTQLYLLMAQDWQLIQALLGGTHAMRLMGEYYLPKEAAEEAADYTSRLNRSFLYNALQRTLNVATDKVFSRPMTFKDRPPMIEKWCDNVDLQGRNLHAFSRDVFQSGVADGIAYVLVDMPPTGVAAPSLADDVASGRRPYLTKVDARHVIGWRSELVGAQEVVTSVRILENRFVPVGTYGERFERRVRVLTPGHWELWIEDDKGKLVIGGSGDTGLNYIPLVPFYTARTGFMTARAPLINLAWLNLQHWQSSSDQNNILKVARLPILHVAEQDDADSEGAPAEKIIGANRAYHTDINAKIEYVEHSGAAINAGRQSILDIERQMEEMSYSLTSKTDRGNADISATENIFDAAEAHSALQSFALNFQDTLNVALGMMADMAGLNKTRDGGTVLINREFGGAIRTSDFAFVLNMRTNGDMTQETVIAEAQRRGIIAEDIDVAAEAALATKERKEMLAAAAITGVALPGGVSSPGGNPAAASKVGVASAKPNAAKPPVAPTPNSGP